MIFQDQLPSDVPGLGDLQNRRTAFATALVKLQALVKDGKVTVGPLDESLHKANASCEALHLAGLGFVRRVNDGGHDYFVANLTSGAVRGWFPLFRKYASVQILDPLTGNSGSATIHSGNPEIYLQLDPGESVILRTSNQKLDSAAYPYFTEAGDPLDVNGKWHVEFIEGGPKLPATFDADKLASWTAR